MPEQSNTAHPEALCRTTDTHLRKIASNGSNLSTLICFQELAELKGKKCVKLKDAYVENRANKMLPGS